MVNDASAGGSRVATGVCTGDACCMASAAARRASILGDISSPFCYPVIPFIVKIKFFLDLK